MSGGISAIKGFDYQATVILDLLFDHFDCHVNSAYARPEGLEDLDLSWIEEGVEHKQYIQIKKPTEDSNGKLNPSPWTLTKVISQLMKNTTDNLLGNCHRQIWVLGDEVENDVIQLINSSKDSPNSFSKSYWTTVHRLARNDALASEKQKSNVTNKLNRWKLSSDIIDNSSTTLIKLVDRFCSFANQFGTTEKLLQVYRQRIEEIHITLPDILLRIDIRPTYGSEREVAKRVNDRLAERYKIQRPIIENTLFRNLRGFINDISKQLHRRFNLEELEYELRSVWPHMIPVKNALKLDSFHIKRKDLSDAFTVGFKGKAVEAIGISGSGKTSLTAEVIEASKEIYPERLVYYTEIRGSTTLRDALVGVAFKLRRMKIEEPFSIAIEADISDEQVISHLAQSYSSLSSEMVIIIDLVDGTCSEAFARDLACFIRALSTSRCRIAVFGQESALRELSSYEKEENGVNQIDVRGFRFEEFVALVTLYHKNPDRSILSNIYHKITAGGAAGLFAKLAESLARAQTLQVMSKIASKPAEEILAHAEQQRFSRLSIGARPAAEKLVCFALPFTRQEAENAFPEENIAMAIRELMMQGLLRKQDQYLFEMHEIVRAGLESLLSSYMRKSAHKQLASWYKILGNVSAEIFHLEQAGDINQACNRAKEEFLQGNQWDTIYAYILRHKLVSIEEVIEVIGCNKKIKSFWMLPYILQQTGKATDVDKLFKVLSENTQRYFDDHNWASAILIAIFYFAPQYLHKLILFTINEAQNNRQLESAFTWLGIAIMRNNTVVDSSVITMFKQQTPEIKKLMSGILLKTLKRECLHAAFECITSQDNLDKRHQNEVQSYTPSLHLKDKKDTVEFLAAIPQVKLTNLIQAKSALLGSMEYFVLSEKKILHKHCIVLLEEKTEENIVIENAIRVLIFLGEPRVFNLVSPLTKRNDSIRPFATMILTLSSTNFNVGQFENMILDDKQSIEDRCMAILLLANHGINLSGIYTAFKESSDSNLDFNGFEFMILMSCIHAPFPEAIPILEKHLTGDDFKIKEHLLSTVMVKIGELSHPSTLKMLLEALSNSSPIIRINAAQTIGKKRTRKALSTLIKSYAKEEIEEVAVSMATAIIASGPYTATVLSGRLNTPPILLWQCILTMRLRDIDMADKIVSIAIDKENNWQLRRTAIMAAGALPFELALEIITPIILSESSPLTIDHSDSLYCHAVISSVILSVGEHDLTNAFVRGKNDFVNIFSEVFERHWEQALSTYGAPKPIDAATWLYERLAVYRCSLNRNAADNVLNELHIPLLQGSLMRALSKCNRSDIIENNLSNADNIWYAMRSILECARESSENVALAVRLEKQIESSSCRDNIRLIRVIEDIKSRKKSLVKSQLTSVNNSCETSKNTPFISNDNALHALLGRDVKFTMVLGLNLESLTKSQCKALILLADPENDPSTYTEKFTPQISFTNDGHKVAQQSSTSSGSSMTVNEYLRPAIVVANRFELPIPWFEKVIDGYRKTSFINALLACFSELNDSDRFYSELEKHENIIFTHICNNTYDSPILKFIDGRIIPTIERYIWAGTDHLFEGLCLLSEQIQSSEIDPILEKLLFRWTKGINVTAPMERNGKVSLWRGFKYLVKHPRFNYIHNWQSMLEGVSHSNIAFFHKADLFQVLERSPSSYTLIESELFKVPNWEHFWNDEAEKLDSAAEMLFGQVEQL